MNSTKISYMIDRQQPSMVIPGMTKEMKSELEATILGMQVKADDMSQEKACSFIGNTLSKTIARYSRELANEELSLIGVSVDQQFVRIEKFLATRGDFDSELEVLPSGKWVILSKEYKMDLEKRIQAGNKARTVLEEGIPENLYTSKIVNLVEKICDGNCASWIYIQCNMGLAFSAAKAFSRQNHSVGGCGFDLLQDSAVTMFEAIRKYDGDRGSSLSTFGTMFLNNRMPRITKKYMTSMHVSEAGIRKAYVDYRAQKKELPLDQSAEDVLKSTDYKVLTNEIYLDQPLDDQGTRYYETIEDMKIGDPAKIVENKSFNAWMWGTVYKTLNKNYPPEWVQMFTRILIQGKDPKIFAEKFSVSDKTIYNRMKKMKETVLLELMRQQDGFRELTGKVVRTTPSETPPIREKGDGLRNIESKEVPVIEPSKSGDISMLPLAA